MAAGAVRKLRTLHSAAPILARVLEINSVLYINLKGFILLP